MSQKFDSKMISFATDQMWFRRAGIQRQSIWPVRLPPVTAMLGLPLHGRADGRTVQADRAFFDLLIETATTQTRKNGEFTIPGLGKLVKAQRAARMGRNPATGEAIKIKASTTVKFRLSKSAKDAVVPPKA